MANQLTEIDAHMNDLYCLYYLLFNWDYPTIHNKLNKTDQEYNSTLKELVGLSNDSLRWSKN